MARSNARSRMREPSQRQLRVGELVRHALADVLQRGTVHDPALEKVVVTIPEVRVGPDMKLATVYIVPLGGDDSEGVLAAFERNKRFLRGEIARRVELRHTPDLRFRLDTSFDEARRIDALLGLPEVRRDLGKPDEPGEE